MVKSIEIVAEGCTSEQNVWDIVASASPNSNLAGVLASILLAVIAIIALDHRRQARHSSTLGLFATTVTALTLDAYLYGNIAGISTSEDKTRACARAWMQGIAANGLLAASAVALACGLAWILTLYVVGADRGERTELRQLVKVGGTLVVVVLIVVNLLVLEGEQRYARLTFSPEAISSPYMTALAYISASASVLVGAVAVAARVRASLSAIDVLGQNESLGIKSGALYQPTIALALFAIASSLFAGSAAVYDLHDAAIVSFVALSVVAPSVLAISLCWNLPRVQKG